MAGRLILIVLLILGSGCTLRPELLDSACRVKVGILAAATVDQGREQRAGYEQALAEINQAGYLGRCTLEGVYRDDPSAPDQAAISQAMSELAAEGAVVLLGPTRAQSAGRAAGAARLLRIPLLLPSQVNVPLEASGERLVFENAPARQAALELVLAEILAAAGEDARIALVFEQSPFGESQALEIALAARQKGLPILVYRRFTQAGEDAQELMKLVGRDRPDAVLLAASDGERAREMLVALRVTNYRGLLFGLGSGFHGPALLNDTLLAADEAGSLHLLASSVTLALSEAWGAGPHGAEAARSIWKIEAYSAAWVAAEALRELQSEMGQGFEAALRPASLPDLRLRLANQLQAGVCVPFTGGSGCYPVQFGMEGESSYPPLLIRVSPEGLARVRGP